MRTWSRGFKYKYGQTLTNRGRLNTECAGKLNTLHAGPSGLFVARLVPKLKVFGVRYRRWIKESEEDEIRPMLVKIIQSRVKTEDPLQSVRFWPTEDTPEADAEEIVPLHK